MTSSFGYPWFRHDKTLIDLTTIPFHSAVRLTSPPPQKEQGSPFMPPLFRRHILWAWRFTVMNSCWHPHTDEASPRFYHNSRMLIMNYGFNSPRGLQLPLRHQKWGIEKCWIPSTSFYGKSQCLTALHEQKVPLLELPRPDLRADWLEYALRDCFWCVSLDEIWMDKHDRQRLIWGLMMMHIRAQRYSSQVINEQEFTAARASRSDWSWKLWTRLM